MQEETNDIPVEQLEQQEPKSSLLVTLLVFMAAVALVRFVMPTLVEEVHYSIERGKQRAQWEVATERLQDDPLSNLSSASQLVNRRISPSVVHIDTNREAPISDAKSAGMLFDLSPEDRAIMGQGSGIVISNLGEIITNYHVVESAEKITVTLSDDRQFVADVVGVDRRSDLALLQIDTDEGLVPVCWGDSDQLDEGSMVWAVGSPFGLSKTITFGILSAKARRSYDRGQYHSFLQSDAAVSAGNSGGPLVDSQGRVVGINTAIIGPTYQGISFAIPANQVRDVYENVLSHGPPETQGWLGVRLAAAERQGGALIDSCIQGLSPAADAGIRAGDLITKWGDAEIQSHAMFRSFVAKSKINEPVRVTLERHGSEETLTVTVKVGSKPLQFR